MIHSQMPQPRALKSTDEPILAFSACNLAVVLVDLILAAGGDMCAHRPEQEHHDDH